MVLDTKNRMEVAPLAIEDDVLHLQHEGDNGLQSRRGWPPLMTYGMRVASTYGIGVASTAMLSTPHSSDPLRILKQENNYSKVMYTRDIQKVSIG